MKTQRPLVALTLLLAAILHIAAAGFIPVRNFDRHVYRGGPQNWGAVQDSLGRVFIGNRDGMLMFDGIRWRTHYISNYTAVRSLSYIPSSRRIYAGGSQEFGYFEPDPRTGELTYTSLIPLLGQQAPSFSEIWHILDLDKAIWFQSDYHLFRYDGKRITTHPAGGRIATSAVIGHSLLLGMDDGRILRLEGNKFIPLPGTAANTGRKPAAILPWGNADGFLLATAFDGLFIYKEGELLPLESDINPFLIENQIFSAAHRNGNYVFGTVNCGAVAKNFSTGETRFMNKDGGMQNNTVLAVAFDRDSNLWLCLDNGLDYALFNSPVCTLAGNSNSIGAGYASLLDGNRIFFGTNQGLYSASYPFSASPQPLPLSRLLQGQIWSVTRSGHGIFASGDAGLFHDSGSGFRQVAGVRGAYTAIPVPGSPDLALASTYDRFRLLRFDGSQWTDLGPVSGYDDIGGFFQFDDDGDIWLSHFRKGVYRLRLNAAERRFDEVRLFSDNDGIPYTHNNSVSIMGGHAVISAEGGFYRVNPKTDRLVHDFSLSDMLKARGQSRLLPLSANNMLIIHRHGVELARTQPDGFPVAGTATAICASDFLIPGYENATVLSPRQIVVANQEGFWCIDPHDAARGTRPHLPFVSAVTANSDSLVYIATQAGQRNRLHLPHDLNTIRIDFGYPDFRSNEAAEFSSWLEGYDSDWSPYSPDATREYTRLAEGEYTFHLRARDNVTGTVSESEFRIRVTPPWWRSTAAKIIYALLLIAACYALFLLGRRWFHRSQRSLEQRKEQEMAELRRRAEQEALMKDYEIASLKSQQLEHDVRHKSSELSNTTMNLIRKNEILNEISDRLSKIQEQMKVEDSSPVLRKQVTRIQSSIRENISHDDDWSRFTRNFDVVYENFTRTLMERHPNLTAADQRLCCYIRMHLSSKEIAPLINISYKSVEMARYRLRKKMNLPPETNLSDYLTTL